MSSATAPPAVPTTRSSEYGVAPAWHTAIVLLVMLGISLLGARVELRAIFGMHGRVPNYLFVMVIEWATVAFIWWGLKRRGVRVSDVVGGSWARGIHVLRDIGIGIAFIFIVGGAVQGLVYLLKVVPPPAMREMLPQTWFEMIVWVPLSVTGGFCEELIFRGYLQRQFSALTHSVAGGIVLQAMAFGLGHGYQGWKLMSLIAVYGACFGVLAHWRRSLRPGIIGHALQDTAGGLLARFLT
jgi:membrane protease YdiL (CAAX protease family)